MAEKFAGLSMVSAPRDSPSLEYREENPHALLLIAREADLFAGLDWEKLHRGKRSRWSELGYLENDAASLAAAHGLASLATAYERQLGQLSEDLLGLELATLGRAEREFRRIDAAFLRLLRDATPFVTAVRAEQGSPAGFFSRSRGTDFKWSYRDREYRWYEGTARNLVDRVTTLRASLRDAATIHGATSTAIATRANLRLQRGIAVVTLVAAALAALTVREDLRAFVDWLF